jgi:ABC-type sugar transport system substrate-binding protein
LLSVVGFSGCGLDPFGPPARSQPSVTERSLGKARTIFLISPIVPNPEIMVLGTEGQAEANADHAMYRVMGPGPEEGQVDEAVIVKRAIADNASGLLVIPSDSTELPKVLADAEAKGIAVVLFYKSIPAPQGSKPFTVIDYAPFDDSAKKIVGATVEDLKKAGRTAQGTALVLVDQKTDRTSSARVAALKAAASAAGFAKVVEVPVDGVHEADAKKQILEAIKAHPDLAIVLTDDPETMRAAGLVRQDLKGTPLFFIGGYVEFEFMNVQIPIEAISCYVQGRYEQMGRLATRTILSKLKGQTVPERVGLSPGFHRVEETEQATANSVKNPPAARNASPTATSVKPDRAAKGAEAKP